MQNARILQDLKPTNWTNRRGILPMGFLHLPVATHMERHLWSCTLRLHHLYLPVMMQSVWRKDHILQVERSLSCGSSKFYDLQCGMLPTKDHFSEAHKPVFFLHEGNVPLRMNRNFRTGFLVDL